MRRNARHHGSCGTGIALGNRGACSAAKYKRSPAKSEEAILLGVGDRQICSNCCGVVRDPSIVSPLRAELTFLSHRRRARGYPSRTSSVLSHRPARLPPWHSGNNKDHLRPRDKCWNYWPFFKKPVTATSETHEALCVSLSARPLESSLEPRPRRSWSGSVRRNRIQRSRWRPQYGGGRCKRTY